MSRRPDAADESLGELVEETPRTFAPSSGQLPTGIIARESNMDAASLVDEAWHASLGRQENAERFSRLAKEWREDTMLQSSSTELVMHPAYQQIIGMGKAALPLIFAELQARPGHWFWALWAITGENPVPKEFAGNVFKATEIWLEWGNRKGYCEYANAK